MTRRIGAAAALVAVLVAGCGGSAGTRSDTATTASSVASTPSVASTASSPTSTTTATQSSTIPSLSARITFANACKYLEGDYSAMTGELKSADLTEGEIAEAARYLLQDLRAIGPKVTPAQMSLVSAGEKILLSASHDTSQSPASPKQVASLEKTFATQMFANLGSALTAACKAG